MGNHPSLSGYSQLKLETTYLEATRIYRNYQTNSDELGRPNPLLIPTSNEAIEAELQINRDGIKKFLSSPTHCVCETCCDKLAIATFCLYPVLCVPCICYKMVGARQLVDPAVDAHTLVLRERTLYYKVTPYNGHGTVDSSHWGGEVVSGNPICCNNCSTAGQLPGTSRPALGFDGFIPHPTGMNVNIEQVIPLELIDEIVLIPPSKKYPKKPFSSLIVRVRVPNFNRINAVQVDMPLNGSEFVNAVLNAKQKLIDSNETIEKTDPALFQKYVEYLASLKKVKFADWQAIHGGLQTMSMAVAIAVAAPEAADMSRGKDLAGQLRELKELFDAGALSAEEFAAAKQSTLSGGSSKRSDEKVLPAQSAPSAPPAPYINKF